MPGSALLIFIACLLIVTAVVMWLAGVLYSLYRSVGFWAWAAGAIAFYCVVGGACLMLS